MSAPSPRTGPFKAVIFDFDGTILDTETPVFDSWRQLHVQHGIEPLDFELWVDNIGKSTDQVDPVEWLTSRVDTPIDIDQLQAERRSIRDAMVTALDLRAGVTDWFDRCAEIGLPLGIGSSSPIAWVGRHLDERMLRDRFSVISCAGDGVPGKPDPAVYLAACAQLGVNPADAVAIEDSHHGVSGAKAAGMTCIAVPGPMTQQMDFSHADEVAGSLAEIDLDRYLPKKF